mmetsp:Transcript_134092/g.428470  ORF Transcript_134092/g.428470 Transcript_134092/m.428470 type:complete len:203 (+) Transcript_134092:1133-1741(+)
MADHHLEAWARLEDGRRPEETVGRQAPAPGHRDDTAPPWALALVEVRVHRGRGRRGRCRCVEVLAHAPLPVLGPEAGVHEVPELGGIPELLPKHVQPRLHCALERRRAAGRNQQLRHEARRLSTLDGAVLYETDAALVYDDAKAGGLRQSLLPAKDRPLVLDAPLEGRDDILGRLRSPGVVDAAGGRHVASDAQQVGSYRPA